MVWLLQGVPVAPFAAVCSASCLPLEVSSPACTGNGRPSASYSILHSPGVLLEKIHAPPTCERAAIITRKHGISFVLLPLDDTANASDHRTLTSGLTFSRCHIEASRKELVDRGQAAITDAERLNSLHCDDIDGLH